MKLFDKIISIFLSAAVLISVFTPLNRTQAKVDEEVKYSKLVNTEILLEDTLEDNTKAEIIRGFNKSNAYANCGFTEVRSVIYRSTDSEKENSCVLYDIENIGIVERAEFDITVAEANKWLIEQPGGIDSILFLINDATEEVKASSLEGYNAQKELLHSQLNHHSYKLTYKVPQGNRKIKFDTSNFGNWGIYITGVRFYGEKPQRNDGELLHSQTAPLKKTYYIPQKIITKAEITVRISKYDFASASEGKAALKTETRLMQYSLEGKLYDDVLESDIEIEETGAANSDDYEYILKTYFPLNTKYIQVNENDKFILTDIAIYGGDDTSVPTEPLIMGDFVESFAKAYKHEGFGFNSFLGAKTGLANPRVTAYRAENSENAYVTYAAPNNGTMTHAEFDINVTSWKESYKVTDEIERRKHIFVSRDGENFEPVIDSECIVQNKCMDGMLDYTGYKLRCHLPVGSKYIKIDASDFNAWDFVITQVLLYGARTGYDYSSLPSLYKVNSDYFNMAVAIEPRHIFDARELLLTQYNELTIENQMKAHVIHPRENVFSFSGVDQIVEFAQENGLRVRGHGLVYEKTMPDWFFKDENGNEASKELVMERLEHHVRTVVRRYKGKIYCYDLVNEMFDHRGWDTRDLSRICGADEYIRKVYQWAHEEDPDAILIINDNFYDIPEKRRNIYDYVKELVDDGVPVHGIGFQEHQFLDTPLDEVEEYFQLFSSISNFKLFVTELDIQAFRFEQSNRSWPQYMEDEIKELSAKKYAALFDIYRKYSEHIETVGMWNVCDGESWSDVSNPDIKHFATLFGYEKEPNPSYWRVADVDKRMPRWDSSTKIPEVRSNNYIIDSSNDLLIVRGTSENDVTAKFYSNFGEKVELSSKTKAGGGAYEFEFEINTDTIYTGETAPEYILEVTDGLEKNIDTFIYYTNYQRNSYYTIDDDMSDFSQMYRDKNLKYNDTQAAVGTHTFWSNANRGSGEAVYALPWGVTTKSLEIEMYKYGILSELSYYDVYYSQDDINYTLADIEWNVENYDSETKKCILKGRAKNISDLATYWKIDTGTAVNKYLKNVKIKTKPLIESELKNNADVFDVSGYEFMSWAGAKCGLTGRGAYYGGSGAAITFNAGEGKQFGSVEFKTAINSNSGWIYSEDIWRNQLIMYSDDGINWTKAGNVYAAEPTVIKHDNSTYNNYTVKCRLPVRSQYVKIEMPSGNVSVLEAMIYGARLNGGIAVDKSKDTVAFSQIPVLKKNDGTYKVIGKLKNNSIDKNGVIYFLGLYDGSRLVSVNMAKTEWLGAETEDIIDITAEISGECSANTAKLFVLLEDGMMPLTGAVLVR